MKIKQQINSLSKSILFMIFLVSIMLFLTGCSQLQSHSQTTNYFTGTSALEVEFLDQAPPQEVYEGSEFDVQLVVANKGAFSLEMQEDGYEYEARLDLKYDTSKVSSLTENYLGQGLYSNPDTIQLYGKSYYFPEGEDAYIALERFKAKEVPGNFERNTVSFHASLCYPYQTFFSDHLCIDTDPENLGRQEQICETQDQTYSGGQGAPIAVTAIESIMVPRGAYVQPQFVVHLKHLGDGSFANFILEQDDQGRQGCGDITYEDNNIINFVAKLGNDTLSCTPSPVYFDKNGEAKVQCLLDAQNILATASNYETTFYVELSYLYSEKFTKQIDIKRLTSASGFLSDTASTEWDCPPWQIFIETGQTTSITGSSRSEGYCEDLCVYCRTNPTDKNCVITDTMLNGQTKNIALGFSCSYKSVVDCDAAGDDCILQTGLCPYATYCGLPLCMSRPGGNSQPKLTYDYETSWDLLKFYCSDKDDVYDQQRSCGCSETSYYYFLEVGDTRSCEAIPLPEYGTLDEAFYNAAAARMEYTLDLAEFESNNGGTGGLDLCLAVKDNAGATSYQKVYW